MIGIPYRSGLLCTVVVLLKRDLYTPGVSVIFLLIS